MKPLFLRVLAVSFAWYVLGVSVGLQIAAPRKWRVGLILVLMVSAGFAMYFLER